MSLPSRALPSRALPSRALPSRALQLIHDYSKPMTRTNWRKSKPIITTYKLYLFILKHIIDLDYTKPPDKLRQTVLYNISQTEWYQVYTYIRFYGLSDHLYIQDNYMLHADGIQDAIKYHCH